MEETFTEHRVRSVLMELGFTPPAIEDALRMLRLTARAPGALGYTDNELKGTARDEPSGVQGVRKQVG